MLRIVEENITSSKRQDKADYESKNTREENPFATRDGANEEPPAGLTFLSSVLFPYDLNPVNEKAQSLVTCPEGLDLDTWFRPNGILPLQEESSWAEKDVDEYGRPKGGFSIQQTSYEELATRKPKKVKNEKRDVEKKKKRVHCSSLEWKHSLKPLIVEIQKERRSKG